VEFDVRYVEPPKPDLAIENLKITKTSDTFQVSYAIRNIGTDPAQSPFDMKAKIYVIKDPTTIMTREDVFRPNSQPMAPGASVQMGPFVIRDSRNPSAGLVDGIYRIGVYTTQGCSNDTSVPNNYTETSYNFWQGGGDYAINGVAATTNANASMTITYRCAIAQSDLKMGLFSVNETGTNPKLGWQAAAGTSGTLTFKAPALAGRYQFKLYRQNGPVLMSSTVFTVVGAVTAVTGVTSGHTLKTPAGVNSSMLKAAETLKKTKGLNTNGGLPDKNCGQNPVLPGMKGYVIEECVKRLDAAMILMDEEPESGDNPRYEGIKTYIRYAWPE
jgi:hypothetical protein